MVDLYSQIYSQDDISGDWAGQAEALRNAYVGAPSARLAAIKELWDGMPGERQRYSRMVLTAHAAARLTDAELPRVSILVPMFREPEVLPILVHALRQSGIQSINVVIGPYADTLLALARRCDVQVIRHSGPADELVASQRLAVNEHLRQQPGADLMLLVADLPLLAADDIRPLLRAWAQRPAHTQAQVPVVGGVRGHPVLLSWQAVQAVAGQRWLLFRGDDGRELLRETLQARADQAGVPLGSYAATLVGVVSDGERGGSDGEGPQMDVGERGDEVPELVEEVARIASLTKLKGAPLARSLPGVPKPILTPLQVRERTTRRTLAALG